MNQIEDFNEEEGEDEFVWRDKAIELILKTFKQKLDKKTTVSEYFAKYDQDHDAHLTPAEFRKALLDLKES